VTSEWSALVIWLRSVEDARPLQTHTRHLAADGHYDLSPLFMMWLDRPDACVVYGDGRRDYRWPLRAALARLDRLSVPHALPRYGVAIRAYESSGCNLDSTASALAPQWPICGDLPTLQRHLLDGLRLAQAAYRVTA
jgi:hypothetical protein